MNKNIVRWRLAKCMYERLRHLHTTLHSFPSLAHPQTRRFARFPSPASFAFVFLSPSELPPCRALSCLPSPRSPSLLSPQIRSPAPSAFSPSPSPRRCFPQTVKQACRDRNYKKRLRNTTKRQGIMRTLAKSNEAVEMCQKPMRNACGTYENTRIRTKLAKIQQIH